MRGIRTPARSNGGAVSMLRRTRRSSSWCSRSRRVLAAVVRSMPRRRRAPGDRNGCTPRPGLGGSPLVHLRAAPIGPARGSVPSGACACTDRTSAVADWSSLVSIIPAGVRIKPAKHPCRIPADDNARGDVVKDDGVNADDRVAADPHAGEDRDLAADPDVLLDHDRLRLARTATINRRFRVGEMVPNLAGAEHAIGADIDPIGGDDRAAVQAGVAADVDYRLAAGGDEAVYFGVRPGVDVRLEHDPARTGDP